MIITIKYIHKLSMLLILVQVYSRITSAEEIFKGCKVQFQFWEAVFQYYSSLALHYLLNQHIIPGKVQENLGQVSYSLHMKIQRWCLRIAPSQCSHQWTLEFFHSEVYLNLHNKGNHYDTNTQHVLRPDGHGHSYFNFIPLLIIILIIILASLLCLQYI